jgi:hypothetical protein
MFQPKVLCSYLLKRWRLVDTRSVRPAPPETSFPNYEVVSTTREASLLEIEEPRIP